MSGTDARGARMSHQFREGGGRWSIASRRGWRRAVRAVLALASRTRRRRTAWPLAAGGEDAMHSSREASFWRAL